MDRNIITAQTAAARNRARAEEIERYVREAGSRPTGLLAGSLGGDLPIDLQKPDSWYERILKYVPVEAVSMYMALDKGVQSGWDKGIQSPTQGGSRGLVLWLAFALVCCVAFNIIYLIRVARVISRSQVTVSSLALVAYVYINGGVFAAAQLAPPIAQLFVLVLTGAVLIFFKPLQPAGIQSGAASAHSGG
jgi:hypothetical protein